MSFAGRAKSSNKISRLVIDNNYSPISPINLNQKDKALPVNTSKPNFTPSSCISGTASLIICEISLFGMAANREAILLVTYASLASIARRNWRRISE